MAPLGLLFVGSVLLVNGLSLLGVVGPRAAAPINAFVGALLVTVVLTLDLPALSGTPADVDTVLGSVGFLLFAFTYLYVAIGNWAGTDGRGLGWYCAWAAVVSLFLSAVSFLGSGDVRFGTIWLSWTLLFSAFFVVLALGSGALARPTGYLTVLQAFTTTTIPGALQLLGVWSSTPAVAVIAVQVAVALVFTALVTSARRRRGVATAASNPATSSVAT